ncbi:MAG TPA: SDR family oxidoreductase [bacterium]|nr:SDR family oxidoreductase [bacterium]HPN29464.1 SDR family oxidoreductase [bacterium]
MIRIGITGADGFIGGNLSEYLILQDKFKIKKFDKDFYKLKRLNEVKKFTSDLDVIIHLAGSIIGSDDSMNFNIYSAYNLMKSCEDSKKNKMFIYLSTTQIYGYYSDKKIITEDYRINPPNYHCVTKFLAEQLLLNSDAINPVILRCSNVYGFGTRPFYNSAIATFIENIYNKKNITLNNKGLQKRSYIYIKDICRIIEKIILHEDFEKGIYNLTSNETIRICDAVKYIEEFISEKANIDFKSIPEKVNRSIIDNRKILKKISGFSFTKFKEGLKEYISEYRKSKSN